MISFVSIVPHPPIIVPEIGKDELFQVQKTASALSLLNCRLKEINPDTILVISPHGIIFQNKMTMMKSETFKGSLSNFGCALSFKFEGDTKLAGKIQKTCLDEGMPLEIIDDESTNYQKSLDHGILVPFYYLCSGLKNYKILPIFYSLLNRDSHLKFGRIINKVIEKDFKNKKIAIVASGDLSHRLRIDSPAGFTPQGKIFDDKFVKLLRAGKLKKIINMNRVIVEEAGECGFRSFLILFGILESLKFNIEVLSYEAPFGVGYLVCDFIL